MEKFGISARLAFFYFAIFIVGGVYNPFWPVWLTAHGLSAVEIGLLTGMAMALRVITGPLIAFASDRVERQRAQIILFSILLGVSFALFTLAHSFAAIFMVTLLTSTLIPSIMPLIDTLTLAQSAQGRADYGRICLWRIRRSRLSRHGGVMRAGRSGRAATAPHLDGRRVAINQPHLPRRYSPMRSSALTPSGSTG